MQSNKMQSNKNEVKMNNDSELEINYSKLPSFKSGQIQQISQDPGNNITICLTHPDTRFFYILWLYAL